MTNFFKFLFHAQKDNPNALNRVAWGCCMPCFRLTPPADLEKKPKIYRKCSIPQVHTQVWSWWAKTCKRLSLIHQTCFCVLHCIASMRSCVLKGEATHLIETSVSTECMLTSIYETSKSSQEKYTTLYQNTSVYWSEHDSTHNFQYVFMLLCGQY